MKGEEDGSHGPDMVKMAGLPLHGLDCLSRAEYNIQGVFTI